MNSSLTTLTSLLDGLVNAAPGPPGEIWAAIVTTSDGLLMVRNTSFDETSADTFAAAIAGLHSASRGVSNLLRAGNMRTITLDFDSCLVMVMTAGHNSRLAVAADPQADMGYVAFRMTQLIQSLQPHLGSASRTTYAAGVVDPASGM